MSQQSQKASALPTAEPPVKRKRGRPRKDENFHHGESMTATPGSDNVKKNKQTVDSRDDVVDEMVGQVVTGVIESSVDAGYLIHVKVGNTDTQMRGVVFLPGRFTPITAANDVAPHVKMYTRKEVPFPIFTQQSQLHGFVQPEQSSKQPVEQKNQQETLANQTQPSNSESDVLMTPGNYSATAHLSTFISDIASGRQIIEEINEVAVDGQSTPVTGGSVSNKVLELEESLKKTETSSPMEGTEGIVTDKESKAGPASETVAEIFIPAKIEPLPVGSDPKNESVNDVVKSSNLQQNQTPVVSESLLLYSELPAKSINDMMEKQASPEKNAPRIESEHAIESLNKEGKPTCASPNFTVAGSFSAPNAGQPAIMFDGEVVPLESIPKFEVSLLSGIGLCSATNPNQSEMMSEEEISQAEHKLASEGSVHPEPTEPLICSSPGAISNVEGNIKDVIPPQQS